MENNVEKKLFPARIVPQKILFFWLIFGFFFLLGLFFIVQGEVVGKWFMGFGGIGLILMFLGSFGVKVRYEVSKNGIYLIQLLSKQYIAFSEIREVSKISQAEVENMFWQLRQQRSARWGSTSVLRASLSSAAFGSIISEWNLLRYTTVPMVRNLPNFSLIPDIKLEHTWGDFILITTMEGKKYLISPQDIEGFLEMVDQLSKLG